jgi:hypothetical protein
MLLLLPRIADYTGGYTMLGLGDIVLPGLLVSFAIRYDVSTRKRYPTYFILMVCWGWGCMGAGGRTSGGSRAVGRSRRFADRWR